MTDRIGIIDIIHSSGSLKFKLIKLLDLCLGGFLAFIIFPSKKDMGAFDPAGSLLVIRPGGMGDAVVLLPVLNRLRAQYPFLTIDILCERRNAQVFLSQALWQRNIYCYDDMGQLAHILRKCYDYVVDTEQWHYLSALMGHALRKKALIGFATRPLRKKVLDIAVDYDLNDYELNNFIRLFEPFGLQGQGLSVKDCFAVAGPLQIWAKAQLPGNNYAALFIGASIPERRLTIGQLKTIIDGLRAQGFKVVLLGGVDVLKLAKKIVQEVDATRRDVLDYVGQLSLEKSAAIIQQCTCFIGADSGLMHVASALDVPVIALFGPGNMKKWAPQGERDHIIYNALPCSPCTRFGYTIPTCEGKVMCMRDLDLNRIQPCLESLRRPEQ